MSDIIDFDDAQEENEIPLVEAPASNEVLPYPSVVKGDTPEPYEGKFKNIEWGVEAYEVESVGCLVKGGGGIVFIPETALVKNADGTYDLIRGRKFRG